jgi:RNA polymerase sigma-70 factor (ECF subfamily)
MASDAASSTSTTLLARLRQSPADQAAWSAFVGRYGPRLYSWCRHWRLQPADAEDVTQDVLARLGRRLGAYDPSRGRFRTWLRAVAENAWKDFLADRRRAAQATGDSQVVELLQTVEARDDLRRRLEEEFDLELLEIVKPRVRGRVEPRTWEAYRLTAEEQLSGAEAGARLGLKVATVFVARSKVQKMLREELHNLEEPPDVPTEERL